MCFHVPENECFVFFNVVLTIGQETRKSFIAVGPFFTLNLYMWNLDKNQSKIELPGQVDHHGLPEQLVNFYAIMHF